MMQVAMQTASALLLLILAVGLAMIFRVKSPSEKIMVSQFLATVSIGWLLLQGTLREASSLFDVGLLFALLATLTTVAFVFCGSDAEEEARDGDRR